VSYTHKALLKTKLAIKIPIFTRLPATLT